MDLHISIANGFVTSKIYDKPDDFDFDMVNFPFWIVTFLPILLMVYTFHNLLGWLQSAVMLWTSTLEINVNRAIGIINFETRFLNLYRRHYKLVSKFNIGFKSLLREGLSEPELYGDLV